MIKCTKSFADHIKKLAQKKQKKPSVRIAVKPSGCAQFSYQIMLDDQSQAHDQHYDDFGITILIDNTSLMRMEGSTIDFKKEGLNSRTIFENPLAVNSCGCGDSFSLAMPLGEHIGALPD